MKLPIVIRNICITALGILMPFCLSLLIQIYLDAPTAIPLLFVFSVFVIALTTQGYLYGTVAALDAGANDYVTKPFGSAELMARVRSAIRSSRHNEEGKLPGGKFHQGDLTIDYDARRIFMGDNEIRLTQTEYNIVALLSQHCGKVMTYAAIMKEIWGYADQSGIKKLQANMANIRRKLGERPGENNCISNELGVGYQMNSFEE